MKRMMIIAACVPLFALAAGGLMVREARSDGQTLSPQVMEAEHHDVLPSLSAVPVPVEPSAGRRLRRMPLGRRLAGTATGIEAVSVDEAIQESFGGELMPAPDMSFEGVNNVDGVLPPDTEGDVGPDHYVQWVNLSLAVYDKTTGTKIYGPVPGNTLWSGFGGPCQESNDGDPVVLYDHLADRWLMTQFALPNYPDGPFYQCVAVSTGPDPTGGWYRYSFSFSKMNDYAKFGVWQDGYYLSVNQFASGTGNWAGAGVAVLERDKMLLGETARIISFDLFGVNQNFFGLLPAHLQGPPPPAGTPNFFASVDDSTNIGPSDALRLWNFHADWSNTANATFGLSGQPNDVLPVASFTPLCPYTMTCIPQPLTSARLDAIGERLMYRLHYRSFADHESLVVNHTVDAGGGKAGVRWYEVRDPGGTPDIFQQGTYAPDAENRWMGSINMDQAGNMALGYSVSSASTYPSIRYTGRLATDPLGQMPQGETTLMAGGGSQTSSYARWGDYSTMSVDPDGCTFWYTQEYYSATSSAGWRTRIGSFQFPSCLAPPSTGALTATIDPPAAVDAGARWRLDGGEWLENGALLQGLDPGTHALEFLDIAGWVTPAPQAPVISAGATTFASGTYLQKITITSPNGGEVWRRGRRVRVRWTCPGDPGESVRIQLLFGKAVRRKIAGAAPIGSEGLGSFAWTVPAALPVGKFYRVRVTVTTDPAATDTSDGTFRIR